MTKKMSYFSYVGKFSNNNNNNHNNNNNNNNNNNQNNNKMISNSNSSLDNTSDQDYTEFLNEYLLQNHSPHNEPDTNYEEGELEAEWLTAAGFPQLIKPFEQGLELRTSELDPILANLSKPHAEAIRQRVRTLNRTVRGRSKSRQKRKPDIRDVFRDFDESSTGTRSRSATPDSLDSIPGDEVWNSNTSIGNHLHHLPHHHHHHQYIHHHHHQQDPQQHHHNHRQLEDFEDEIADGIVGDEGHSLPPPFLLGKSLKQKLRRTPSAPLKATANGSTTDIFRGSHRRCEIPMYSADGIELLGFSRIGTIHIARNRSGSDPSCSVGRARGELVNIIQQHQEHQQQQQQQQQHNDNNTSSSGESSDECLTSRPISGVVSATNGNSVNGSGKDGSNGIIINGHSDFHLNTPPQSVENSPKSTGEMVSFESLCRKSSSSQEGTDLVDSVGQSCLLESSCTTDIDTINESDLKRLQPLFWLELASIFDRNQVQLDKRKPVKRRRKEEGHLFGVSINALIRRDQQITGRDSSLVPLFLEGLLAELSKRGVREEGILRVAGHKQKTETLYQELEGSFYQKPQRFQQLLSSASVHDLSALLKRWLRELPQPLLTNELIRLFYQCHVLPSRDQVKALTIICQLLPHENRNTLRSLLRFLGHVVDHSSWNKMNLHNVATIAAPSFFPPRFVHPVDKNNIKDQVKMAAQCCCLTTLLITIGDGLFQVPDNLIEESRLSTTKSKHMGKRRVKASTSLLAENFGFGGKLFSNNNLKATTSIDVSAVSRKGRQSSQQPPQQSINPSHIHRLVVS